MPKYEVRATISLSVAAQIEAADPTKATRMAEELEIEDWDIIEESLDVFEVEEEQVDGR